MSRPKGTPKTGGRQPGVLNKATADLKAIASDYGQEAIDKLVALMRTSENEQVQKSAADSLLDRGYGKPTQAVEGTMNVTTRAVYLDPTAHLEEQDGDSIH